MSSCRATNAKALEQQVAAAVTAEAQAVKRAEELETVLKDLMRQAGRWAGSFTVTLPVEPETKVKP